MVDQGLPGNAPREAAVSPTPGRPKSGSIPLGGIARSAQGAMLTRREVLGAAALDGEGGTYVVVTAIDGAGGALVRVDADGREQPGR